MSALRIALGIGALLLEATVATAQTRTVRVSVDSSGAEADGQSINRSISADGAIVSFESSATNLVAGDTNGVDDAFVHDLRTGITERVSVDSSGAEADGATEIPFLSADGRFAAFSSFATNLVAGDTNQHVDAFLHDRSTGSTERVSVDSSGGEANGGSFAYAVSADGQVVAFQSDASNLVTHDTNAFQDVFVHDRSTGITERVSLSTSGHQGNSFSEKAYLSRDGRFVAFSSFASNLVHMDLNGVWDVFVHDRAAGTTERVSIDSSGTEGDLDSFVSSISADGRFVTFYSTATNLVAGDTNGVNDAFLHDRATGVTERISVDSNGGEGDKDSYLSAVTPDGALVAFYSDATNLVAGDSNGVSDVFVRDRTAGSTVRVSLASNGGQASGNSWWPSISDNGRRVSFASLATNLVAGDNNKVTDAFVFERLDAAWLLYGSGFAGTNGIPTFTAQANPVLGTTITLDLANSWQQPTIGVILFGGQRMDTPSGRGGELLVAATICVPINFAYSTNSYVWNVPNVPSIVDVPIDLQAIEVDPGAAKGLSFTQGLELLPGY
jgi:hypothetical protein